MVADTPCAISSENAQRTHSVNFPEAVLPRVGENRLAIANAKSVPNMVGQIFDQSCEARLNMRRPAQQVAPATSPTR